MKLDEPLASKLIPLVPTFTSNEIVFNFISLESFDPIVIVLALADVPILIAPVLSSVPIPIAPPEESIVKFPLLSISIESALLIIIPFDPPSNSISSAFISTLNDYLLQWLLF